MSKFEDEPEGGASPPDEGIDFKSSNTAAGNLFTIPEGEVLEFTSEAVTPRPRHGDKPELFLKSELSEDYKDGTDGEGRRLTNFSYYDDDEDESSVVSLPAELPPPPDGGWGWVIVFVSFLANMVVDGTAYSFSPFLNTFSEYFNQPQGTVAWIPSLLAGVYLSAGPIVSAFTNKFGCRPVCIVGSIIAACAYGSTVFANSVIYLMITQGFTAGFGFGLIYLPAVVCVGYYFEKKRALATGIAVCGSGVGTMIFPPLVNFLIRNYGWKGANLFLAGIILNCCWMGALMRPLEVHKMRKKDLLHRLADERKIALEIGSLCGSNYLTKVLNPDPGVHSHLNLSEYLTPVGTSLALPTIEEANHQAECLENEAKNNPTGPSHCTLEGEGTESLAMEDSGSKSVAIQRSLNKTQGGVGAQMTPQHGTQTRIPQNKSQPDVESNRNSVPQILSAPNFDRRMSRVEKMEAMTQLKVVPATPEASYTNLRSLSFQERRASQGYKRSLSGGSFSGSSEYGNLRRRKSSRGKKTIMLPPMSRQDIFFPGSIENLNEFKRQPSRLSYRESTFNLQNTAGSMVVLDALKQVETHSYESLKKEKACCPEDFCGPLSEMMDFSLLKNPVLLIIGFANMIGMLGFYTPFVYLPAAAIQKGIDKDSATLLVSIIGITNTVGRVLSGLLADIPQVNALWVNNVSIIFSGLCVFLTPFATSFGAFVTIAVFFGFFVSPFIALCSIIIVEIFGLKLLTKAFGIICVFRGVAGIVGPPVAAAYISLTSVILVELLGLANLTNAFGILILFRGSASMVGSPLAGSIYDATKNYDVSFYFSGLLLFLCSALHCMVPCIQRWGSCHQTPVRYHTNEEYLQAIPEEETSRGANSPDVGEGAGIMFDIKPKEANDGNNEGS